MLTAAGVMVSALAAGSLSWQVQAGALPFPELLTLWVVMGIAYAGLVTPGGRLLRRSAKPEDLPFLFAAQFSLSHVCWLLAYPLAGWLGSRLGLGVAPIALTVLATIGLITMLATWPTHEVANP